MNNKTILVYYIYVLIVLGACGYVVFGLGHSGWWFLLALVLIEISPKTNKKERDEENN